MYTPEVEKKVEDRLLATHVANNAEFEKACLAGDGKTIMSIVDAEMEKNDLYTKGSKKLKESIARMLNGRTKVSASVGSNIMFLVWNSRMSGIGLAVQS